MRLLFVFLLSFSMISHASGLDLPVKDGKYERLPKLRDYDQKSYTYADYRKERDKLGNYIRPAIPCPCIWSKKRGRDEDYVYVNYGIRWKCRIWEDNGQCKAAGVVRGE